MDQLTIPSNNKRTGWIPVRRRRATKADKCSEQQDVSIQQTPSMSCGRVEIQGRI